MPKLFSRSRISLAVSAALSISTGLGVGIRDASAQEKVERVEVTGSNIRRAQTETASPIQVITRAEIENSGKATVADYLQSLAIDGQGSIPPSFGNGFAAGAQGISLRGLGAGATLVLLNGRRMAPYGLADDGQKVFTDLSIIPMEAVERIEILKDSASSVYGSDAIAGVVNVIMRTNFNGTVANASIGASRYNDGSQKKIALTRGWGDLASDGMNMYFNVELSSTDPIFNRDRTDRKWIGQSDLRPYGYDIFHNASVGVAGAISGGGTVAGSSPTGSVRNPTTLIYQSLPGCARFSSIDQTGGGGGCLWSPTNFVSLMPKEEALNMFGRGTWKLANGMLAYAELTYSEKRSESQTTPSGVSGATGFPGGPVNSSSGPLATQLGATHPDNPFGVGGVLLRYSAFDVGPRISNTENHFTRFGAGLKGKLGEWDFDTALVYSATDLDNTRRGFLRASTLKAALADPTSSLFPYRIGINSGLNPASLYAAISPIITANATSKMEIIDFRATRDVMQLQGGPMGVALGAEYRREESVLQPTTFTDQGDIIGLGFSAYDGKRTIGALYAEVLAPVHKMLELSASVRMDHYSEIGNSTTPKAGIKFTPIRTLALRGTYSEGFRAPNAAESGTGGLSAFTTALDPVRCPGGTPAPGATNADCNQSIAIITSGNPNLSPEKSKSATLGAVWDPVPSTSITVDTWQIKRTDEIFPGSVDSALAGGGTATRADNNLPGIPNSGTLLAVSSPYVNAARTTVKGTDLDFLYRLDLGNYGKAVFELRWTHLSSFLRVLQDGTESQFAGTHGNCDVTNCIGTPKDKVNATLNWDKGDWRVTGVVNYRGYMQNTAVYGDVCASAFADGSDAPNGCKIPSFWTMDLSARWRVDRNMEVYGSIQNLFDKVAPLDPLTYGAISFNPADVSGAIGRYFTIGMRYQFK